MRVHGGALVRADLAELRERAEDPASRARWDLGHTRRGRSGPDTLVLRYTPTPEGVRVSARRETVPRTGRAGHLLDRALAPVRSLLLAWSLDRLRLWAERGTPPGRAAARWLAEAGCRIALVALLLTDEAFVLFEPVMPLLGYGVVLVPLVALPLLILLPPLPGTPSARRAPAPRTARGPRLRTLP